MKESLIIIEKSERAINFLNEWMNPMIHSINNSKVDDT
jgi:hypothetical protein